MGNVTAYTHLGLTLAVSTLAGFFLGYWLDGKLGTRPLLAIVGAFIGGTAGFINLVRTLNDIQKSDEDGENGERGDG